jgi:hypothetical protein
MKKRLALAITIIALASNISLAQNYRMDNGSDAFFITENNGNRQSSDNGDWDLIPALFGHGYTTNQAAPLGSGLLILGGMALGYGIRKRK